MPSPSTRNPLHILLPVATSLWLGALVLTVWASARISKLAVQTQASHKTMDALQPEANQFASYWEAVGSMLESPTSAPQLHEWVDTHQPTLFPTSHAEQITTLPHSHLHMRTATVTWKSIEAEDLQTIIETAQNAPASYRLSKITLTPAARDHMLKVEAVFCAFTQ